MAEQKKKRQSIAEMKRELQDMQIASRRRQEGKQATGESVAKEREAAGMGKSSKPEDKSKYVSPSGKQYAGPGYSAGSAPSAPKKPEAAKPAAKPAPKPQQAAPVKPAASAKPETPKAKPKPGPVYGPGGSPSGSGQGQAQQKTSSYQGKGAQRAGQMKIKPTGPQEGDRSVLNGKPVIRRNGKWVPIRNARTGRR